MSLKHSFNSAKADGADATQVQPSNWNADHVVDANGITAATSTTVPAAPIAGNLVVFGKSNAGLSELATVGADGVPRYLAPSFGHKKIGFWNPGGAGGTFDYNGGTSNVSIGTETPSLAGAIGNVYPDTASLVGTARRVRISSSTANNANCALYSGNRQLTMGSIAKQGGFKTVMRWAVAETASSANVVTFMGVSNSIVSGGGNVSNRLSLAGVGTDIGDTNWSFMNNDAVGVATKTPLGANFPAHTAGIIYELTLYSAPNSGVVGWQLVNINTGNSASGSVSSDLPVGTDLIGPSMMRNTGNPSGGITASWDFLMFYCETDF
jgi:hypothetical protein